MPAFLLHVGATVLCIHGGQALPLAGNPRMRVGGQPVTTLSSVYLIAGCLFAPPVGNGPCVNAQWLAGAARVRAGGQPVLLAGSPSACIPTGTPLVVVATQVRVRGM